MTTVLAGCAVAVSAVGSVLAFTDLTSPLRAPFALLHLFATPAAALSARLSGMEWAGRLAVSAAGSLTLNLCVAQAMSAPGGRSARNGVLIISVCALIIFLSARLPKIRNAQAE